MRRRRRRQPHASHERWLVSYADFITLLFAFFVVLYSSSQVDKRRVGRLAQAIQVAFQELGVFQTSNTKVPVEDDNALPFEKVQIVENVDHHQDLRRFVNPMTGALSSSHDDSALPEVQQQLESALSPEIQRHEVTISMRPDGLVVSLEEIGFFDSGTATIREGSLGAIGRLAAVLRQRPENLRVEGHTDNVPIHNSQFASNWELSTYRATEITRLFIARYALGANRLSAAGYAEYHPVASNDTAPGRAQNRRVDVVVLTPFQHASANASAAKSGRNAAASVPQK
jgi:chemotaxis protein MotB